MGCIWSGQSTCGSGTRPYTRLETLDLHSRFPKRPGRRPVHHTPAALRSPPGTSESQHPCKALNRGQWRMWAGRSHSTLHASFPPALEPAQIMLAVMFPLKESLLLHLEVETMGSLTVRRMRGFSPPLWLVEPHPETRHMRPASSPVFCLGSGASDTYLFSSIGALSWKNQHPETDLQIRVGMKAQLASSNCYTIHYKAQERWPACLC